MSVKEKIIELKKEKDAVILAHNYQRPEIYEVADFLGDSLELALKAKQTREKMIVFCGVSFMAETAKILNPSKKVVHPDRLSACPMAAMPSIDDVTLLKKKNPKAAVVSYVNTTAEIKALSDACCTSSNAVKVVNSFEQSEIIFLPDKNLAAYVQTKTKKKIIPFDGHCYVHGRITPEKVKEAKMSYPRAEVVAHPECMMEVIKLADAVCSTSQMISYCRESRSKEFILATEEGMRNRLKLEIPSKSFYSVGGTCIQMKKITLEKVLKALESGKEEVVLDEGTMEKARKALERMVSV